MGRFSEESHTDLREWYHHCLDFRALRRRLVDDPPDPWDDHPSMSSPQPATSSIPSVVSTSGVAAAQTSDIVGVRRRKSDSNLAEMRGVMSTGPGSAPVGGGFAQQSAVGLPEGLPLEADLEAVGGEVGKDVHLAFSDPATRVFAFELNQELERVWYFYQGQNALCAAKLSTLYDKSAYSRHKLHRKLGGSGGAVGGEGSATAVTSGIDNSTPSLLEFGSPGNNDIGKEGSLTASIGQEHLLAGGADVTSKPRIRGRKSAIASPPPTPGQTSGGAGVAVVGPEEDSLIKTTEDPYVRASLKRSIVELYDTCHRLLSFKMLNYDACVRLVELHCKSVEADALSAPGSGLGMMSSRSAAWSPNGLGRGGGSEAEGESTGARAGGAVIGGGVTRVGFLQREKAMKVWLLEQPLFASRGLNTTLAGAELLYASLFCHGDVDVARTSLTFKSSSSIRGNRRFDFGYRLGAATILLVWAMWDCLADPSLGSKVWEDPAFQIFRGLGNLILLTYMWGINVWVWRRFGIDYQRCLNLDPKGPRVDPCEQVWNTGCNLSIVFLAMFICFYKALRGVLISVPPVFAHTFPLLLLIYTLFTFATPWSERKGLLATLWTVMISPLGKVRFLEGYVGDILTSVVRVMIDVAFALLYFTSLGKGGWLTSSDPRVDPTQDTIKDWWFFSMIVVPFLTAAPLWWRFQQNLRRSYETRQRWPHLGNALKYATAMSVSIFGTFRPVEMHHSPMWVLCFIVATLYQFTWDIFMDWDLFQWDGRSLRLRQRLLYRKKWIYIAVTFVNLVLRFLWTVTLVPEGSKMLSLEMQKYLSPFIAAAEIMRRTMWGFLRVENEHLRIYGGGTDEQGSDADSQGDFFLLDGSSPSASTAATSSVAGSFTGGDHTLSAGGNVSRGNGLDRLPYTRMDMNTSKHLNNGISCSNPLKAWCLTRVRSEARRRLLGELCAFSVALGTVCMLAFMSRGESKASE